MSRIKNLSRGAWIVVGIVMALVIVPSGVAMATLAYTGIEGTNGTTTINEAKVTAAGQLLTTEATPPHSWSRQGQFTTDGNNSLPLANPPSGQFDVVTEIQIDAFVDPSPGSGDYVQVTNDFPDNLSWLADVNPPNVGDIVIPINPGQPTDNSGPDANLLGVTTAGGIQVTVIASGYFAPCSEYAGVEACGSPN